RHGWWSGRVQSLDVAGDGRRACGAVRGAGVARHLHLGVEALAEAHVTAGAGARLVDDVAREGETGREVLARGRSVVQLEALRVVRDSEGPGLGDGVVGDGGVDRGRVSTRRSCLQEEPGSV